MPAAAWLGKRRFQQARRLQHNSFPSGQRQGSVTSSSGTAKERPRLFTAWWRSTGNRLPPAPSPLARLQENWSVSLVVQLRAAPIQADRAPRKDSLVWSSVFRRRHPL